MTARRGRCASLKALYARACRRADMRSWEPGGELLRCERGVDGMAAPYWLSFPTTSPHHCSAMPHDTSRRSHPSAPVSHPLYFWFSDLTFVEDRTLFMLFDPFRLLPAGASAPARLLASAVVWCKHRGGASGR